MPELPDIRDWSLDSVQRIATDDSRSPELRDAAQQELARRGAVELERDHSNHARNGREARGAASAVPLTPVVVRDFDMPFGSMVLFMVKWAIAAVPAIVILAIVGALIAGVISGMVGR